MRSWQALNAVLKADYSTQALMESLKVTFRLLKEDASKRLD
jgi:hypothetical protein